MDLFAYLALLRRSWLALLLCFAVGGTLGYGASFRTEPQYRATASVYLSPGQGQSIGELAQGSSYTRSLVQSYVRLATTPTVLQPVVDQLGLDTTPGDLADRVSVESQQDTVLLDITAVAGSGASAAAIANAVGDQLADATESLSPRGTTAIEVTTVTPATAPRVPFSPDRRLDAGIGAVLGLLLVVGFVVAREVLDTRVRDADDVLDVSDVPVLAAVPPRDAVRRRGRTRRQRGSGRAAARGDRTQAVRRLRANLRFLAADGSAQQVVLASAAGDGAPDLALELARAVADHETRVLLLEADLRSPVLARTLGLGSGPGLVDVLVDGLPVAAALRRSELDGPAVLPAGTLRGELAEAMAETTDQLVGSAALQRILADLRTQFDVVLITAPPVLEATDAAVLAARVDGVALVAESPATRRRELAEALRDLEMVRATVLGVVLDHSRRRGHRSGRTRRTTDLATPTVRLDPPGSLDAPTERPRVRSGRR
ncbi:Wzz/FepE/Etk N-terminal domain-containing protein [Kineococcus endophyticus]|uniref:Wzz/FepE/Etk N-terminal domain-containing protein n=1 Tax=Kineococcus endophyticus TaxID=1181883 RepID=A0ABV3P1L6_9ACTN